MPEHPNSRQPRLIVVDDDPDIRDLIVRQLRQDHYEVLSAGGVSELKAALVEQRIDLIVLDLNLPDGDGLELCRELRGQGNDVWIIMVSARGSAIDRVLGLELGADDYLTKPFEPRELLVRVRNLLRRAQPDDAERQRNKGARVACFGPWRLDLFQRRLIAQDVAIHRRTQRRSVPGKSGA
jgi:two-component system OmpR family response regulator